MAKTRYFRGKYLYLVSRHFTLAERLYVQAFTRPIFQRGILGSRAPAATESAESSAGGSKKAAQQLPNRLGRRRLGLRRARAVLERLFFAG